MPKAPHTFRSIFLGVLLGISLTPFSFAAGPANTNPSTRSSDSQQQASDAGVNQISADQDSPGPAGVGQGTNGSIPWAMFHQQPSHIAFNGVEHIISKANVINLELAWVGVMGDLVTDSSPAVLNGIVYIGSFDGRLYAFKANGCGQDFCQPIWSGQTGNDITSSPAVTGETVFVGSADRKLYAFAAHGCGQSDCQPLWVGPVNGSIDSGPVVTSTMLYVGSEDHNLYAFAVAGCGHSTCAPLWSVPTGGGINSSPALVNNVLYFGSQDGKLYAVDARGCGQQVCAPLWTAQVGSMIFASSPAVANGVVYIASFNEQTSLDSRLYAFNANGCGQSTCEPLWTAPAGDFVASSPAVANGKVYVGSGDDLLYAFDANGCGQPTCDFLWRGIANGFQAALVSSPAVANGLVYVGENNGMLEIFDANGCGQSICLPLNQLRTNNEPIVSSSPAVVNGTVYFGSADQLSPPIGRLYVYKLGR